MSQFIVGREVHGPHLTGGDCQAFLDGQMDEVFGDGSYEIVARHINECVECAELMRTEHELNQEVYDLLSILFFQN